ncbi:hypothetical protein NJB93_07265 [Brucella intermedia]|uniref:hypothetical protein n=1 Tax=Brucella intermedia TaxID=94625 RepID=UPI002097F0DB|nr:hypothetical protein [Brucella intermedia]MCO7726391.1 hypothetical protein [Brucella intermedia]
MSGAFIRIPDRMGTEYILNLARHLDYYAKRDSIRIEFADPCFLSPFGLLFISSKLKDMRRQNPELEFDVRNHEGLTYAGHMGFFRMFGVKFGREIGEAFGNENYLPITCLSRTDLYKDPIDRYTELGDLIQRESEKISTIITRNNQCNRPLSDALAFSIREVMRNVFEHSEANEVYYCAQYWPNSGRVEFALVDFGIGIRRGLGENPNFRFPRDKDAIEYALLPSVSGKTHLPRRSENWFNSGYGLYMTNRLARNGGGNFVVASGNTAIQLSRKTKHNFTTAFPGTALRFNLKLSELDNVQAQLDRFRKEGFEIAKTIKGTQNRPPSAMSLLLRRDYTQ